MNITKFGMYIASLRKEHDLSQYKLANLLNVTRQAVSKWERGEGFPNILILYKISKVFDISVDTLLNASEVFENEAIILNSASLNKEITNK